MDKPSYVAALLHNLRMKKNKTKHEATAGAPATVLAWAVAREGHEGSSCAGDGSPNSCVVVTPARRRSLLCHHSESPFSAMTICFLARRFPSSDGVGWGEGRKPLHAGAAKIMRDDVYNPARNRPTLASRGSCAPRRSPERHANTEVRVELCHRKMHEGAAVTAAATRPLAGLCLQVDMLTFPKDNELSLENTGEG